MTQTEATYSDSKLIYDKLSNLLSLPPLAVRKDAMDRYLDYFDRLCVKSRDMVYEAKSYIPGGVQHNLAFNYPFPLVFEKSQGAYLHDVDGNRYIDFLQAGGPTILGANPPQVREQVIELINHCGPSTGLFHEFELKIAKEINRHMPWVEMFRMLNSGTEAVMAAIRVARLVKHFGSTQTPDPSRTEWPLYYAAIRGQDGDSVIE